MIKTISSLLLVLILSACAGTQVLQVPGPNGEPIAEARIANAWGFAWDNQVRVDLIHKVDGAGNVLYDKEGKILVERVEYMPHVKGGTGEAIVRQIIQTGATVGVVAATGGFGRRCGGGRCGGGGTQIINNPQSFSEAGSFSDANVNSVTDVGVGCPTC